MANINRFSNLTTKLLMIALLPIAIATFIDPKASRPHDTNHVSLCEGTLYPSLCISTLAAAVQDDRKKYSTDDSVTTTINTALGETKAAVSNCTHLDRTSLTLRQKRALDVCIELLDETVDDLEAAMADVEAWDGADITELDDIRTLLSAAMTDQYTCLEGFDGSGSGGETLRDKVLKPQLMLIAQHASNALALLRKAGKNPSTEARSPTPSSSEVVYPTSKDGYPRWLKGREKRLLHAATNEITYDLVVAKDGSGNFTTIVEAVEAAPNRSTARFVIYIKAGVYFENVEVISQKTNLMFVGDGIEETWIKDNRSVVGGWSTFQSATVAVSGAGFIARDISIENYAGPHMDQAVALRVNADFAAFYKCRFIGYQDTLYPHSFRQFYRECIVYGTIDFVFGNAAAVFQKCSLYARVPRVGQRNMFTAQSRVDPYQNTGFSILNSKVEADADLANNLNNFRSYLGRPWRPYSRVVVLLSYIGEVIDPAGWHDWDDDDALKTLYYGEYENRGPGSDTSGRVTWPGYRVINSSEEASQFTVGNLTDGEEWLTSYGIPVYMGLTE